MLKSFLNQFLLPIYQAVDKNDWIEQSASTFVNANYNGKTNSIRK